MAFYVGLFLFFIFNFQEIFDVSEMQTKTDEAVSFKLIVSILFALTNTSKTSLRGYAPHNHKVACFVLYLKIIDIFLKNDLCIL